MREEIDKIKELINDRPYYICKVNDDHTDVQTQFGGLIGKYKRELDRKNEEYLEREILSLIKEARQHGEKDGLESILSMNSRTDGNQSLYDDIEDRINKIRGENG